MATKEHRIKPKRALGPDKIYGHGHDYSFIFSDNIDDWVGSKKRRAQEKFDQRTKNQAQA